MNLFAFNCCGCLLFVYWFVCRLVCIRVSVDWLVCFVYCCLLYLGGWLFVACLIGGGLIVTMLDCCFDFVLVWCLACCVFVSLVMLFVLLGNSVVGLSCIVVGILYLKFSLWFWVSCLLGVVICYWLVCAFVCLLVDFVCVYCCGYFLFVFVMVVWVLFELFNVFVFYFVFGLMCIVGVLVLWLLLVWFGFGWCRVWFLLFVILMVRLCCFVYGVVSLGLV